ncbi:hypothetical protein SAMN04489760_11614 [Syntrophus gentianae]|uniref:DUF1761 domain-containing protein n=1 Tax=Syntrophus gentianae TaxID=43775 RepID=A0A1H7YHQ7_9BACT|nr:hypothetical protein [Syntrophus gentianae]SEM44689.1 hypothetical protein SAMN04489760_11614 [Syntrophus gentianae]
MTVFEFILAAVLAGIAMAALTELGYRLGMIKANLLLIDGEFALKMAGAGAGQPLVYVVGVVVHLVTSAVFGAAYYVITRLLNVDPENVAVIAVYVFLLWLSMLFFALPVAGQGLLGRRAATSAWYEQLVLHVVFGGVLWMGLALF